MYGVFFDFLYISRFKFIGLFVKMRKFIKKIPEYTQLFLFCLLVYVVLHVLFIVLLSLGIILTKWYLGDDSSVKLTLFSGIFLSNILLYVTLPGFVAPFGMLTIMYVTENDGEYLLLDQAMNVRSSEFVDEDVNMGYPPPDVSYEAKAIAWKFRKDSFLTNVFHYFPSRIYNDWFDRHSSIVSGMSTKFKNFRSVIYTYCRSIPNSRFMLEFKYYSDNYGLCSLYSRVKERLS